MDSGTTHHIFLKVFISEVAHGCIMSDEKLLSVVYGRHKCANVQTEFFRATVFPLQHWKLSCLHDLNLLTGFSSKKLFKYIHSFFLYFIL